MDADDPLRRDDGHAATGMAGYAAYYPPETRGAARHVLDVTPMYYYQATARRVIPDLPDSRAIFIAHRPSERVLSLYAFAQNNIGVLSKSVSLPAFLEEIEKGADSEVVGQYPMMRNALEHSRYAAYLRDWQAAMGPERLKILIFDDIAADPRSVLHDLARWIGIAPEFYDDYAFPRENETYTVKNQTLHRLARRLDAPAGLGRRAIRQIPDDHMTPLRPPRGERAACRGTLRSSVRRCAPLSVATGAASGTGARAVPGT